MVTLTPPQKEDYFLKAAFCRCFPITHRANRKRSLAGLDGCWPKTAPIPLYSDKWQASLWKANPLKRERKLGIIRDKVVLKGQNQQKQQRPDQTSRTIYHLSKWCWQEDRTGLVRGGKREGVQACPVVDNRDLGVDMETAVFHQAGTDRVLEN